MTLFMPVQSNDRSEEIFKNNKLQERAVVYLYRQFSSDNRCNQYGHISTITDTDISISVRDDND